MHLKRLPVLTIVILLVLALTVVFAHFSRASAATLKPLPPYHATITFEDGISAHEKNGTPVSLADLQRYILTHPSPCGITVSHKLPWIETLWLTTSEQASSLMAGEYITSSNREVYFVVLRGPFLLEILVPTGFHDVLVSNKVAEVFDAQTGNLLVCGSD